MSNSRLYSQQTISTSSIDSLKLWNKGLEDVRLLYPNGRIKKYHWGNYRRPITHIRYADGSSGYTHKYKKGKHFINYILKGLGIIFFFTDDDKLTLIHFSGKNNFKTDKGIITGISSFSNVQSAYGLQKLLWGRNVIQKKDYLYLDYKGIRFKSYHGKMNDLLESIIVEEIEFYGPK